MAHEVEDMVSGNGITPWHGLGTVVDGVMTAEECIKLAGLDWELDKRPVFARKPVLARDGTETDETELFEFVEIPNRFELVRDSDGRHMSIVSDVYKPLQNRDAFGFMDALVGDRGAKYDTAGSLRHGNVIFLSMKMPEQLLVAGDDAIETYLLLRNTHDGSGRISVYITMVRVVCMNTLTWAVNGARHQWGITHTADVKGKIAQARESLQLTFKYDKAFQKEAEELLTVTVTDDMITKMLEQELDERPSRDAEIDAIVEHWRATPDIANFRNTGWGFLNGLTQWQQHVRENRSGEALFARTLDGKEAKLRTSIKNNLLAVA